MKQGREGGRRKSWNRKFSQKANYREKRVEKDSSLKEKKKEIQKKE